MVPVYDGSAAATVTLADNRLSGDVFTDSFTSAAFTDKNVGAGKTITVSGISISGSDAGNYTVNPTATATADIAPAPLTVTSRLRSRLSLGDQGPARGQQVP